MAKQNNEAKIKFTAETGEFNKAISQANGELSELKAELKANEAQMKNTGATVEALEKQHSLLENQLKASQSKTEALTQKVEKAVEIYGENSSEVTKLKTQLANAQAAEEKIKTAIAKCNSEIEKQARESKESERATKQLTDTIDKQETELKQLKEEYADAVLQYGKTSKEAKDLGKQIENLSDELSKNQKDLKEATDGADKFDKSLDDVGNTSEKTEGKLGKLAVGVAAVGTAMIAAGKEAIDAFNEVDEGADNVIKATGATGEAAAELETAYKNVASSIVGDFGDIGSTLGEVNTRFGFTGTEAEDATKQFVKFAEVTGMDGVSAVQAVSRAIESAGLKSSDYNTVLDALTKAGQATGVSVDTLATSLTDNGAVMRAMGYDTTETIAMLAQFEKAGVDSNSVVRGMRTAIANWSKDGLDAKTEFEKLVSGIKDGSVSAGEAYEVFGSKAGTELIDAIQSGRFEYEDMLGVIEGSKGSLDSTFDGTIDGGYELELAMQNAKMALGEAGGAIGEALIPAFQFFSTNILPATTSAITSMIGALSTAVGWLKEHKGATIAIATVVGVLATAITAYNVVQGVKTAMEAANVTTVWGLVAAHWAQAAAAMAAIAPYVLVVAAIAAVIAIIVLCIKYWDDIVATVENVWESIVSTLSQWGTWIDQNVIQPVVNLFKGLWDGISTGAQNAWTWLQNAWSNIANWVNTNVIQPVINLFKGLWDGVKAVWDGICNAVQVAIMLIGSIISAAVQIITLPFRFIWENCKQYVFAAWEWIKNAVSTAINAVKNVITTVMNAINSVITSVWNAIKEEVSNAVNAVKAVITIVFYAIKNFITPIMDAIKSAITTAWNAVKSAVTTVVNSIKSAVTAAWNAVKTAITSVMNGIKSGITSAWNAIKSGVSTAVNAVKDTVSNVFNGIKSTATSVWNGIKNAITEPIEAAKAKVKSVIDAIKGFFSGLKLKLPKIKLPHFKVEGKLSLNPPSVPKLKIDWYKDGGILTKPTIFGVNGNRLMAGGEAGAEAILPIDRLQGYITGAIEKSMNVVNLDTLAAAVEDLANRPVELNINGRQFAIATAGDTDSVNGIRTRLTERGLAL